MKILKISSLVIFSVLIYSPLAQAELHEFDYKFKMEQTRDALRLQRQMHKIEFDRGDTVAMSSSTSNLWDLQKDRLQQIEERMENIKRLTEQHMNNRPDPRNSMSMENAKYSQMQVKETIANQKMKQEDQMRRIKQQTEDLQQRLKDMSANRK